MSLTTDPKDPRLKRGIDDKETGQHEAYLVLSPEELSKGFIRPVRKSYVHDGIQPKFPLRDLTQQEIEQHGNNYIKYEAYPADSPNAIGRFWTKDQLDNKGCGSLTTMNQTIAETYAANPAFYGATYCMGCKKHLPVQEFTWDGTNLKVGS